MKKSLSFIGGFLYSIIASYLLCMVFYYLTPLLMGFGWMGFILYVIVAATSVELFIASVASIVFYPILKLINNCKALKWFALLPILFHGYSAVAGVWRFNMTYSNIQIVIAITTTILIARLFIGLIVLILSGEDKLL